MCKFTTQVIAVCKSIGFSTVGIGPEDIMEGKRNFLLGILWQMVRASTLKTLQNLRGSRDSEFGNAIIQIYTCLLKFKTH